MAQPSDPWPSGSGEMAALIRSFEWAATPLGPTESWPRSLKTIVGLMLDSPGMMSLVWGPQAIHLYNDSFMELLREHRTLALGRSAFESFARSREAFADDIANGMAGNAARLRDQRYPVLRNGQLEDAWFDVDYAPVRDESGSVAGVLWTLKETTAQARAEAKLRESEARHRLLIESWAQAIWETDGDGVVVADSPSWRAYTGQTLDEWLGYGWLDAIHPDDRTYAERQWREAVAARGLVDAEFRMRAPNGGWRWTNVRAAPVLDEAGRVEKWAGMNIDIDTRKRAEAALRESELFRSRIIESSRDCIKILDRDGVLLWVSDQGLKALECEDISCLIGQSWVDMWPEDMRSTVTEAVAGAAAGGEHRFSGWSRTVKGSDKYWDVIATPLANLSGKPERLLAVSRDLTERRRAGDALRESEERFRQFASASAAGLWIRDADTLAMEFVSPAVAMIYGVEADALLGDVTRWAAIIVPEDLDAALAHLDEARTGKVAVHEFRIQRPADGAFRWIRNTDFPLRDERGQVQRIGGIAEDVTEAKLAAEHSAVLLAELQHRVRNIMALIRSITARTAERAESVPAYRDLMMGRLLAFARVQALLTRTADVSVGIAAIVHDEISAQAQHEDQYALDGPDVALSPKAAEVLTLALHELATNAAKYGALCVPEGKVSVRWSVFEKRGGPWLAFDWTEEGAPKQPTPEAPRRRGFGSELIEGRIPYELRGRGTIVIGPGGARCHLEFPLQEGASILETGAPQRATVFGGAIDMTGEPDLTGRRILVVEDDYYLATDTARALRGAGAEVLGPCATEEDARAELSEHRPDAVVVDINLGPGPSFKLAESLKDDGIPFVFTTGYDAEVIPAEFEGVERLEKPLQLRRIVGAVAKLTKAA